MPTEVINNDRPVMEGDVDQLEGGIDRDNLDLLDRPPVLIEETEGRPQLRRETSIQRELADAIVRLAPVDELKILLKCGAKVDAAITQGLTPLHYAVWQRYPEAAELLIEEGCDINARDDIGYSALHLSAEHGYTDMMEVLLKHNAQVNFNIPEPEDLYPIDAVDEPLRLALKHGHYEAAKMLLTHSANPNTQYFFGSEINLINPLNTQLLHLLLMYGANPDARDRHGFSPIMKACRLQQGLESVLLLISFGADVNLRTDRRHDQRSVLHYAVLSGSIPIVNLLIKQGASLVFEESYNKPTPLDLAVLKGDVEMTKLLIKSGAKVNTSSPVIGSPLHIACSEGVPNRMEILTLLLESGANPNIVIAGEDGHPIKPILGEYLASNENPEVDVVNLLLRYGAEVVMQSQNRNPRGILNSLPNLTKHPQVLISILEAAQQFDLGVISHSSLIDKEQREMYLKVGQAPLPLKHQARVHLRQLLGHKLPSRADELDLPTIMKRYLLYEIS